jgi:predicted anti-sigma-YlaC factor YlaD
MAERNKSNGCEAVRPWLADHVRGESGRLRERIERHLQDCPECREEVAFMNRLVELGREWEPGARLGFEQRLERVVAAAETAADPRRRRRRLLGSTLGLAALAAILLGGLVPTVEELAAGLAGAGWSGLGVAVLASAAVLLLSTPLLIAGARRRTEGGR